MEEYHAIEYDIVNICKWAKEHFARLYEHTPFAGLFDVNDYDTMMIHLVRRSA